MQLNVRASNRESAFCYINAAGVIWKGLGGSRLRMKEGIVTVEIFWTTKIVMVKDRTLGMVWNHRMD